MGTGLCLALLVLWSPATLTAALDAERVVPVAAIAASSALPPWKGYTFDAANLVDGRVDTSWQPAKSDTLGVGQWVELDLGGHFRIDRVAITLGLHKVDPELGDLFCRNNRPTDALLLFDDGTYGPVWAPPGAPSADVTLFYRGMGDPGQEVPTVTRFVRLVIVTVNEPVDWKDLALAEVRVFGRPVVVSPSPSGAMTCDRPGSWPLRVAVSDYCAASAATRAERHCAVLLDAVARCLTFSDGRFAPLAPLTAEADGVFVWSFAAEDVRHRLELAPDARGRLAVTRHTRLDGAGRAPAPYADELTTPDKNEQNPCWEKLRKARPAPPSDE